MNLAEKFLTVLKQFPQYRAVVKPGCIWNYEELDRAIRQIQKQLKSYNLVPQTVIALLIDDPLWLTASIWAVIRERLIYVVLDGTYPQERLAYILEDSQASLLIINEEMRSAHPALIDSVPHHLIDIEGLPLSPEIAYSQSCQKEDIVTLYYTSGSTGKPKGVIHNHVTITHEVRIHTATLKITPNDRFSAIYSLATIGSNRDFYAALLNGASWNFFPFRLYGMSALRDWIEAEKITILHAIPMLFRERIN